MGFKCISCGKVVDKLDGRIRCPYCGYRIFMKQRPKAVKHVQAR